MAPGPSERRILVVEDEPEIRESIALILQSRIADAVVETAPDARSAFAILRDHPVDLVLSDYHLPDMDGVAFLERVLNDQPRTRRAMLTGAPDESVARRASQRASVERFFLKPLDPQAFTRAVAGMLHAKAR